MPCTHTNNCELYVRFAADPSIEVWKKHFCNSDFKKCARYEMSSKGMSVPLDLLPNGKKIAIEADSVDVGLNTLFNAIKKDRLPMVQAIIRVKTINSGDMTNSVGMTPTMYAASMGRNEMVDLFISKGCDPHKKCNNGKTALDYALENNHTDCAEIIKIHMNNRQTPGQKTNESSVNTTVASPSLLGRLFGFLRGSNKQAA